MYEMRYVAFIDILGFKNKVYKSVYDSSELHRIENVLKYKDFYSKNY